MSRRSRHVWLTLGKELRETLRDRRTLTVMILFPLVLYPLLALVGTQVVAGRERDQNARPSTVAVAGTGSVADQVRERIGRAAKLFVLRREGRPADVDAGRLDALVEIGESRSGAAAGPRATVSIVFDATRDESRRAEERLDKEMATLSAAGCPPAFALSRRDLAPGAKVGGYLLSKALPLMILLMVLLGAFYPAIDVTAGERERGTLETVLAAPIARVDLLLGKVLAVTLLASLSGLLNLGSMSLTLRQVLALAAPDTELPIPWSRAAATGLVILPTAFLLAALFVAVGSLARGFKEAQNLLVPVYFLFFAPAMIGALGDFPLTGVAAFVPGMNVSLLARDIALGKATFGPAALVLAATLAVGALALAVAARLYASERFLVATDEAAEPGGRLRGQRRAEPATAGEAFALFGVGYLLLYYVFVPLQRAHLAAGLLVSQWLGLGGLVLVFLLFSRRVPQVALGLRRPSARALAGAVLMGASGWMLADMLAHWLAPPPAAYLETLRRTIFPEGGARPLAFSLFLFALTPAVCEELFFRGLILRGLASRLGPAASVGICGVMFGMFHLDVWRLLPTTLLGFMLSWVAWRARSLWPAVAAHFVNNGLLISLGTVGLDERLEHVGAAAQTALFAGAAALVLAGAWLLTREATSAREM